MTNNLGTADYTVGGDFDVWGTKFVNDMAILSKMAGETLVVPDTSGNIVLTVANCQAFSIQANGSGGTVVNIRVPDTISRFHYVRNDRPTGQITYRCAAGGTAVTLNPGDRRLIYSDGTNCVDLTLVTLSIATITGLQAALDAKAGLDAPTFTTSVTLPGDPASSLQAATKQYVDGLLANVGKRSRVRAASTAALTIAAPGANIDGVAMVALDWFEAKDQAAPAENGIYQWNGAAVPATRVAEFDTYNEHAGSLIAVQEGTVNADTLWLCTSNVGGTLGVTAIVFSQVKIVQAASTSVAGIVALADNATTSTGTDAVTAVTPAGLTSIGPARLGVEGQVVTGGGRVTSKDLGTPTNGSTVTLDPGGRPLQHLTNNVAGFTLAPGANGGSILLDITNGATAGAITTTGWTKVVGGFDTVNGHKFRCSASIGNGGSLLTVQALQ